MDNVIPDGKVSVRFIEDGEVLYSLDGGLGGTLGAILDANLPRNSMQRGLLRLTALRFVQLALVLARSNRFQGEIQLAILPRSVVQSRAAAIIIRLHRYSVAPTILTCLTLVALRSATRTHARMVCTRYTLPRNRTLLKASAQ